MKSGTTSLHDYLDEHPDIQMSKPKEIHYYADENYLSKSIDWYHAFFESDQKVLGTSPQSYTKRHNKYYQHIPERIQKHNPKVKLIYIVRDPIKRLESHVLESFHCDPIKDIRYSRKSDNYLKTSLYFYQLSAYLDYFSKEQILVISMEDLIEDKLKTLNQIFEFLGVDSLKDASLFDYESNTAMDKQVPFFIRSLLVYRFLRKLFPNQADRITSKFLRSFFPKLMNKPKLDSTSLDKIRPLLEEDVKKFRELTGKDFPQWTI